MIDYGEGFFDSSEDIFDIFAKTHCVVRTVYSNNIDEKPNNHCIWQNISVGFYPVYAWVETDEHFRERVKQFAVDYSRSGER